FPYPKLHNPLVAVDLAAAVLLTDEPTARRLGRRHARAVYFAAGGLAVDRQRFLVERSSFTASPPLAAAAGKALGRAGVELAAVDALDLYSCFPCAVAIAAKMLDLPAHDTRPLTLTGGLGFFGGPGNNYTLHAVATLCGAIRDGTHRNGLVTGVGWFLHKHAAGLYSSEPSGADLARHDLEDEAQATVGAPPVPVAAEATGAGTLETYTVVYTRDGRPEYAPAYGRLDDGRRFVARLPVRDDVHRELTTRCAVGRRVRVHHEAASGLNGAELD
ncbi:MAG: acetyl-CoA acetyltransferase, partial [Deferrisomatales bacterium]